MSISEIFDGLDFAQTKTLRALVMDDLQEFLKNLDDSDWLSAMDAMAPGFKPWWNLAADIKTHRRELVEESHAPRSGHA